MAPDFLLQLFRMKTFGDKCCRVLCRLDDLLVTQQCQSTEGNSIRNSTHWPHDFLIHQLLREGDNEFPIQRL